MMSKAMIDNDATSDLWHPHIWTKSNSFHLPITRYICFSSNLNVCYFHNCMYMFSDSGLNVDWFASWLIRSHTHLNSFFVTEANPFSPILSLILQQERLCKFSSLEVHKHKVDKSKVRNLNRKQHNHQTYFSSGLIICTWLETCYCFRPPYMTQDLTPTDGYFHDRKHAVLPLPVT